MTLTLEPEPTSLTPSPLREEVPSSRGTSPGLAAQVVETAGDRIPFDVKPCVTQLLEKDEDAEEGGIVVMATT